MKKIFILFLILSFLFNHKILAKGKTKVYFQPQYTKEEISKNQPNNSDSIILAVLLVMGYLIPTLISTFSSREPAVYYKNKYEMNIPSNISPSLVELLLKKSGKASQRAYSATFLDLAFKGYINVKEENKNYKIIMKDKNIEDNLWEDQKILLFYLRRIGKDFYLFDIPKSSDLKAFKKAFNRAIKENLYKKTGWINVKGKNYFLINLYLWTILLLISLIFLNRSLIIISSHNVLFGLIFTTKSIVYSYEGKLMALKWKAYRRYLKNSPEVSKYDNSVVENLIIYGTLFGFYKKVIKSMEEVNIAKENIFKWFVISTKKSNEFFKSLILFISNLNKIFNNEGFYL